MGRSDVDFIVNVFAFAILGNPLIAWLHSFYVTCTISPLTCLAQNLRFIFTSICVLSFALILANGLITFLALGYLCTLLGDARVWICSKIDIYGSDTAKKLYPFFWKLFLFIVLLIVVPVAVFITFAQFVTPFITPNIAWEHKYKRACDGLDIRVFLDSVDSRPAHSVLFADLASRESYRMSMDPDPSLLGFDTHGVYNFSVISVNSLNDSSTFSPMFERIKYDMGSRILEAYYGNKTYKTGFGLGERFTLPGFGLRGDLNPFSVNCRFDPTVEIFHDGLKMLAMKTVQFTICGQLQVCADRRMRDHMAVAVGLLILQRAGRPDVCCKGSVIPGIAGRDGTR